MTFSAEDLARLDAAEEVWIETVAPDGETRRTVIWVVVDAGEVFVRSVRGDDGLWYRDLVARPDGAVQVREQPRQPSIPVRAVAADDEASIGRCSSALERKYATDPSLASMLAWKTLPTTLRLVPRSAA